jgi:serine/threonine protein kinase
MDVSHLAPFSNVECPVCQKHTRVKREFGPYTLLRRHAIGGMSVVFIAHDNTLNREVVVKILNEEYGSDEKRIGAFEEEARLTASFSHPHVVRVFTTGRAFGRFYIAMELVGGGHYEHHIRERGSIPEAELLPLAIQIADGLKAAQAAGLIHRDVKPGNILLDASGNAKIVDFGLALVTKGGKATATEIWATPYYVPPETIEGMQEDFRSDIYAFGATLYHALAGKPSCDEESMDTNKLREAKQRVLPLAKAAPWVSLDTCTAIDRAMAHNPEHRFRSYNDLISALDTARQRLANGGFADTPARRTAAEHSAKKDKIALIGASLLVTAALAFGIWWIGRGNRSPQPLVDHPPSASSSALPDSTKAMPKSDGSRAGGFYRDAGIALRAGDYARARELFAAVRDDEGVLEPTGSWAACEAVVAAYLDGHSNEARREARLAVSHIQEASLEMALRDSLRATLDEVRGFPPVTRKSGDAAPGGAALMASLIHGLKNWEQGLPAQARPHFDAILEVDAEGADAWLEPYKAIILEYVKDHEKLIAAIPDKLPDTADACHGLANELHTVHASLKTKGRARYNIRAVQLDLEKRARLLEQKPDPATAGDHGEDESQPEPASPALSP